MTKQHVVLLILDGWGLGPDSKGNAIKLANTPTMDMLKVNFPYTQLLASGEAVGLPKGEAGNTGTGHINIGAGRIVYQSLPRINMSIASGSFFKNKALQKAKKHFTDLRSNFHIIGLIGSGGVHSSNSHLYALLQFCKINNIKEPYLHLFTDGRDSPPTSGITYIKEVQNHINELGVGKIATVMGRYYGMDRDFRWERTKVAYDALVHGIGETTDNLESSINANYENSITDEFIKPLIPKIKGSAAPRIHDHDVVVFFNYRIDRPRQLTRALTLNNNDWKSRKESFDPYAVKYYKSHLVKRELGQVFDRKIRPKNLMFITMTEYEKDLPVEIIFPPEHVAMPLSRIIAHNGKRQLKLSESEKERFVTYYFNGQRESPFPGEKINITPSPKVATYDLKPEMSGDSQTTKLLKAISTNQYDLIVINYANPDMVAHTGDLKATIKACEHIDSWIKQIYQTIINKNNITLIITADHGNAEEVINLQTGQIDTEHSSFPVPLIIINKQFIGKRKRMKQGILADIAPTILKILTIQKPSSMSGRSLL